MYLDKTLEDIKKFSSDKIAFLLQFAPQLTYGDRYEKKRFCKVLERMMELNEFVTQELKGDDDE